MINRETQKSTKKHNGSICHCNSKTQEKPPSEINKRGDWTKNRTQNHKEGNTTK